MPRPYSGDLRTRVRAGVRNGGAPAKAVARRFVVGRSSVQRWVEVARAEGRLEAEPMHGGPKPAIRDASEAARRRLVEADDHPTLAEDQDRPAEAAEVRVHPRTLGRALRRLGLTRPKEGRARAARGLGPHPP